MAKFCGVFILANLDLFPTVSKLTDALNVRSFYFKAVLNVTNARELISPTHFYSTTHKSFIPISFFLFSLYFSSSCSSVCLHLKRKKTELEVSEQSEIIAFCEARTKQI